MAGDFAPSIQGNKISLHPKMNSASVPMNSHSTIIMSRYDLRSPLKHLAGFPRNCLSFSYWFQCFACLVVFLGLFHNSSALTRYNGVSSKIDASGTYGNALSFHSISFFFAYGSELFRLHGEVLCRWQFSSWSPQRKLSQAFNFVRLEFVRRRSHDSPPGNEYSRNCERI